MIQLYFQILIVIMDAFDDEVPSNNSFIVTSKTDRGIRVTFLIFFIIIGFVGNCLVLVTLLHHQLHRNLRIFISSLCVVNLIDSLVNISLTLSPSLKEDYTYEHIVCCIQAFGIQLTSIGVIYGLLALVIDRYVYISFLLKLLF